jgi:hypothetical protein
MAKRGRVVTFHGAFTSKAAAVRKERAVGGFIQPRTIRGHRRYVVMSEHRRNPLVTVQAGSGVPVLPHKQRRYRPPADGDGFGSLLILAAVGVGIWYFAAYRPTAAAASPGAPAIGAQVMWFSDPTAGGDQSLFMGSLPPGSAPPWRRANAQEQADLAAGLYRPAGGGLYVLNPI